MTVWMATRTLRLWSDISAAHAYTYIIGNVSMINPKMISAVALIIFPHAQFVWVVTVASRRTLLFQLISVSIIGGLGCANRFLGVVAEAGQIGVRFQQVQKYETAQNRVSASRLFMIVEVLGVDVGDF